MAAINIDKTAINKQIKNSRLKVKIVITIIALLVAISVWIGITILGPAPDLTNPDYEALAKPFNFSIDKDALQMLAMQRRLTPEELEYFQIFIVDEASLSRATGIKIIELTGPNPGNITELNNSTNDQNGGQNQIFDNTEQNIPQQEQPPAETTGGL